MAARFTTIEQRLQHADDRPFLTRFLYQDDAGRLLVIRYDFPKTPPNVISIQCLPSGEKLAFEKVPESTTLRFGGRVFVLRMSDIDPSARGLSPTLLQRAAAVVHGMSPACRAALRRITEIGTEHSVVFHVPAALMAGLVFPDIAGTVPEIDTTSPESDRVWPFDPATTPPNAFEAQFGSAYVE